MSTHSILSRLRASIVVAVFAIVGGLLMALQPALPSTVFAASSRPAPSSGYQFGNSQAMDLASVAVVRLMVTYGTSSAPSANIFSGSPDSTTCTRIGLGTIVSSSGTQGNVTNYVVTDSSVVNSSGITCSSGTPDKISQIQVFTNSAYLGSTSGTNPFQSITCSTSGVNLHCSSPVQVFCQTTSNAICSGAAVFTFNSSYLQPVLNAGTQGNTNAPFGIELNNTEALPFVLPSATQAQQYLTPLQFTNAQITGATTTQFDAGVPVVSSDGTSIVDMKPYFSSNSQNTSGVVNFVNKTMGTSLQAGNKLQSDWTTGVQAYYAKSYANARNAFNDAMKQNPNFQAAASFASLAARKVVPVPTATTSRTNNNATAKNGFFGIPYWLLAVIALVVVVILFLLVMLLVGRRRGEMARFNKETQAANQRAEQEAQRIRMEEATRQTQGQTGQAQAAQAYGSPVTGQVMAADGQPARELRCPHCGYPYVAGNAHCANCGALLSPSASGLNVRMVQPPPQQMPPVPNIQSPVLMPSSISDQPTLEMSPSQQTLAEETTAPGPRKAPHFNGHNISLAVGSGSDSGIKRKQKPNEDSVLAITGERTHNSQPQQFGLFVVADGMGGHANGQDASRMAIQTMVDRILPKLSSSEELDDTMLAQLLVDGVQQANNTVYERNMEHHADMGTTMTSAMVVGSTAHVANVGDSRTYMYRNAEGLHKITHDHSVVASLVEANIIKVEDVYTHPKRNQIYRSLGEKPVVDVDHFTVNLQPGDKLLLCSDGLWEMVRDSDVSRDQDIERILSVPVSDPKQTVNALINAANNGGGEDNISVIVVNATEATSRTGMTGIHQLDKPETVKIPQM